MERVLAIDVIRLLAAEGAYSITVNEQLEKSEVWQAYSRQKHDLFLPAAGSEEVGPQPHNSLAHCKSWNQHCCDC